MSDVEEEEVSNYMSRFLGEVGKSDTTQQIVLGVGSGWLTGYLAKRLTKTTAVAIGGGIILLQVAIDTGLVRVSWSKVNKKQKEMEKEWPVKFMAFLRKNTSFSSGFVGGFFIGMAT